MPRVSSKTKRDFSFYSVSEQKFQSSWYTAKATCVALGGYLAGNKKLTGTFRDEKLVTSDTELHQKMSETFHLLLNEIKAQIDKVRLTILFVAEIGTSEEQAFIMGIKKSSEYFVFLQRQFFF